MDVDDPQKYLSIVGPARKAVARVNDAMGLGVVSISFVGLSPGLDEVLRHVAVCAPDHFEGAVRARPNDRR